MAIISEKGHIPITQADPYGPRMHGYLQSLESSRMGAKDFSYQDPLLWNWLPVSFQGARHALLV